MKLTQLKPNSREIKSIVYINEKNMACVAYSDFEHYKSLYGENTATIYKPNAEQTSKIIEIMNENNKIKSDKFTATQTEYLLRNLTDVELEEGNGDDYQEISDNPPNDVLGCISAELDDIATSIITKLYNASLKMEMLPEIIKEGVHISEENKKEELKKIIIKKELDMEREEMEKKLAQIKKKQEELDDNPKRKTKKKSI